MSDDTTCSMARILFSSSAETASSKMRFTRTPMTMSVAPTNTHPTGPIELIVANTTATAINPAPNPITS